MPDSPAPRWTDDLFAFPTPPALRTLIDIAWQHAYDFYLENESYDYSLLGSHFDFMFDLAMIPRPLDGWHGYPEFTDEVRRRSIPLYATPEFVPFGALGTGAYVGWLVPAPELQGLEHPVVLADGHEPGVTLLGADTRAGLEFMLSWTLRRWREEPWPELELEMELGPDDYVTDTRAEDSRLLYRLAAELGVRPDPDRTYAGSSWRGSAVAADTEFEIVFDVPEGWRHWPARSGR